MPDLPNEVTLGKIAGGAAEELFRDGMKKVLDNLQDPNTDWKATRRITLTFDVSLDDESRRTGDIDVRCTQKLAGVKGVSTQIVVGRHHGELKAVEQPGQEDLFKQPHGGPRPVETVGAGGKV